MVLTIARIAKGVHSGAEEQRLARHARRCHSCRRRARELGIEPLSALGALRKKAAALLPLPWLLRRSGGDGGGITGFFGAGANAAPLAERAAALVAVAALAGAGGAALGTGTLPGDREGGAHGRTAVERSAKGTGERQRGATGAATDGARRGTRRASGQRDSGTAGGRAGGSTSTTDGAGTGPAHPGSTDSTGPAAGGSATTLEGSAPSLPAVPDTSGGSDSPNLRLETSVPELPPVEVELQAPTSPLPEVEVPTVPLPSVDEVTDTLPDLP
jgi:hypothetical protein